MGKTVYVIGCLLATEGCARPARSAMEAGKKLGWHMTLLDGAGEPNKMAAGIEQAINAHANGIIFEAIDATIVKAALAKAKKAGIKTTCFACANQENLFDHIEPSYQEFIDQGYALAAQMYKQTGGHPKMILLKDLSFGAVGYRLQGTKKFFNECKAAGGDCQILTEQNILSTELTTRVPGLVSQLVKQYPTANALWMPYDAAQAFVAQGVRQGGSSPSKVGLYGFDGNSANLTAIRKGDEAASEVGPLEWVGWDQVDTLNRLFAGQQPVENVVQYKLMEKANLPATDSWSGDKPYKPGYEKVWSVQ
jgi:ribose transport system substrate-binding protein